MTETEHKHIGRPRLPVVFETAANQTRRGGRAKTRFLEAYRRCGNITLACELTGVKRVSVYWWQEHDPAFHAAFNQAEVEATERLEAEAQRRAVEGVVREKPIYYRGAQVGAELVTEYSDTLLLALLKARNPEKYRERSDIRLTDAREEASKLAADLGVEPEDLLAEAERIANGRRG